MALAVESLGFNLRLEIIMLVEQANRLIDKAFEQEEKREQLKECCRWVNMGPICIDGLDCKDFSYCDSYLQEKYNWGIYLHGMKRPKR